MSSPNPTPDPSWVRVGAPSGPNGRYYPRPALALEAAGPGAAMWAVSLDRAMLTCFSVEAGRSWPTHVHESEQITLVLEGSLAFQVGEDTVTVGPGEVFAVPGGVPHAVWAGDAGAVAVDAWSPPMDSSARPADPVESEER